jgi:hypothetical protein
VETAIKPTVGRIVNYFAYGTPGGEFPAGVKRAAMITEIIEGPDGDPLVSLCVFNPTGLFFNTGLKQGNLPGNWNWVERV